MALLTAEKHTKTNHMPSREIITVTTMKKTYTKPTARVVALHARQQMLTVSGEISGYSKSASGFSQDDKGNE